MTVLRELVAKLGFQVDDKGFQKAAEGVDKIKAGLEHADAKLKATRAGMGGAGDAAKHLGEHAHAAGHGLEHAGKGMEHAAEEGGKLTEALIGIVEAVGFEEIIRHCLELADEVERTEAILTATFGEEGSKAVQTWSESTGAWLGRSKDDLAAAAAGIGSLIQPLVGSSEKAQEMSEKLTEMGVDMASVFDTSDAEAIDALRGGMAGMGRSLKRYGIVLEDTTLAEYAHTKGISKKVSEMSVAEKAELTYGFLIARTSKYQGDAHKNADDYSNSTKRLGANLKGLGADIGKGLLPVAAKLITGLTKLVTNFKEIAAKSYIVQSALAVLTAGFVVMKWEAIAAFAVPLLSVLAIAAALDELYTLFTGGQSKIGDWLDEMGGIGTAEKLVNGLKDAFDSLTEFFDQLPDAAGMWDEMVGAIDDVGFALDALTDKFVNFFDLQEHMAGALESLGGLFGYKSEEERGQNELGQFDRTAGRGLGSSKLDMQGMSRQRQNQRHDRIRGESAARHDARAEAATSSHDPNEDPVAGMSIAAPAEDSVRFGRVRARTHGPAGEHHVTNNITVNQGPVNVHGAANSPNDVRRLHEAERRKTREAVKHGAG